MTVDEDQLSLAIGKNGPKCPLGGQDYRLENRHQVQSRRSRGSSQRRRRSDGPDASRGSDQSVGEKNKNYVIAKHKNWRPGAEIFNAVVEIPKDSQNNIRDRQRNGNGVP